MSQETPSELAAWFERRFAFDFPVALYPNLRVRLLGAAARLDELTSGLPSELLVRKPADRWSIQENAGHLLDLEPLWAARVEDFLEGRDPLTVADLTNRKTHEGRHNERPLAEIVGGFRTARARLVERLLALPPDAFARTSRHPRLQTPMRLVDHMFFVAEHDDHHLARILELKARGAT